MSQICAGGLLASVWLGLLGPLAPLIFMSSAAGLAALAPVAALKGVSRAWPLLLIGVLACISALWSTAPSVSLRYGVQLGITITAAVIMVSTVSPQLLIRAFFASGLLVLVLCILSGRTGQSQGGQVLIGLLGSKNEMGALCGLVACSGSALIFSKAEPSYVRIVALVGSLLATAILLQSFATGAVLMTLMFAGLMLLMAVASRIPRSTQFALFLFALLLAAPLLVVRDDLVSAWEYFVVDVLGKDTGLTGRDYLWAYADRLISERPLLGYGYRSTWMGDSAETIGLLRWAGLSSGAGFNFHDTYREWAVDFGFLGAVLVGGIIAWGLFRAVALSLRKDVPIAFQFLAAMGVAMMIRAKLETVLGPFGSSTVLITAVVAVALLASSPARAAENAMFSRDRRSASLHRRARSGGISARAKRVVGK